MAIGTSVFGAVGYPVDVGATRLDIADGATDPIKNQNPEVRGPFFGLQSAHNGQTATMESWVNELFGASLVGSYFDCK